MISDKDTWWKAIGNEPRRLANGIDNREITTNTIDFLEKGEVTRGHTATYKSFVRPLLLLLGRPL